MNQYFVDLPFDLELLFLSCCSVIGSIVLHAYNPPEPLVNSQALTPKNFERPALPGTSWRCAGVRAGPGIRSRQVRPTGAPWTSSAFFNLF